MTSKKVDGDKKLKEAIIKKREISDSFYLSQEVKDIVAKGINKELIDGDKEKFLDEYAWRFSQMETSLDKLLRFPIFLSSTHLNLEKRGITKADQFIYHIENYLSSVYIFEQRVKKFVGYLKKIALKYKISDEKINKLEKYKESLFTSIKPIVDTRGSHTHDRAFYTEDLYKIELYEKLGKQSKIESERKMYKGYTKIFLTMSRYEWKDKIKNNNTYCEAALFPIYKIAFDIEKEIYNNF